jgi:hypothetical protein
LETEENKPTKHDKAKDTLARVFTYSVGESRAFLFSVMEVTQDRSRGERHRDHQQSYQKETPQPGEFMFQDCPHAPHLDLAKALPMGTALSD